MSKGEINPKRRKIDLEACILCGTKSSLTELTSPVDDQSWMSLCEAAKVRQFEPVVKLADDIKTVLPNIYYHRRCRSEFTHKKTLIKIAIQNSSNPQTQPPINDAEILSQQRYSNRPTNISQSRVYEKVCIFCQRQTKYIKGTNSREYLKPAVELRADKTVREVATSRLDERILTFTSRDIVAAEAQYHKTCYRDYTRTKARKRKSSETCESADSYNSVETAALDKLYEEIRMDLFSAPRLVPMTDFTSQLVSLMHANGIDTVTDATKNHLRRNLEIEFGNALHFFSVGRRVYARPDNLNIEELASDYIILKNKVDANSTTQDHEYLINETSLMLREEIKNEVKDQAWPPHPEELTENHTNLPKSLMTFLNRLIGGSISPSTRVSRLSWSLAQDIVTAVTISKVLTPKHILLPWVIKTLTGNVELIRIMNRLGHSCSYSTLEEIDTSLCIEKLALVENDKVPLPSCIHPSVPTVLSFDNIDRQEEVLSGAGTSHRVNGIIIQPTSLSCALPKPKAISDKREKKRSIEPSEQQLPIYTVGKRIGPSPIIPAGHVSPEGTTAQYKNFLWILTRKYEPVTQTISSWTGFNILTRNDIEVTSDAVGYLPTINAPATEMSTVHEILRQSIAIQSSLHLHKIAVVFDQSLFAKATEIAWKNPDKFKNIVLMMGNFHTISNLLSIIGKMFGDAGLRDLAVESDVIAEGSINKVLEGKQYNRAVRLHKLTYEALMRVAWTGFVEWLEISKPECLSIVHDTVKNIGELHQDVCQVTFDDALQNESCKAIHGLFLTFLNVLRSDRGPLSSFWMTYLDMVEIMLGLLRADREGNWPLHLSCIRDMIPWCFAMDKTNYARYLPIYYAQMTQLEETCPELNDYFHQRGFSVQLGGKNPFGRIPVDQTTEETVNKDTQTAGGTRGFSLKRGTISRYYLTAEHRAAALRQLRELISVQTPRLSHADLEKPRILRDEGSIASIVDILENSWTNPFAHHSELLCISSGAVATSEISVDMLSAQQKGEQAYKSFQESRLQTGEGFYDTIKKLKLKTFSDMKQKTMKYSNTTITLKADRRVFGNMILIAQHRKLDMQEVLCHPLGPLPWALANGDGSMKKNSKASLAKHIESKASYVDEINGTSAALIDGMSVIQKLHIENQTFDELSDYILSQMLHAGNGCDRIDVVFDTYRKESIKNAERLNRGSSDGVVFSKLRVGHRVKNWRKFLASSESKNNLINFLAESWKDQNRRDRLGHKTMYVTCQSQCFRLSKNGYENIAALESSHEEADTRILLHAQHAAKDYETLVCVADDTDVFVLCLALSDRINSKLYIRRGTKSRVRLVDVSILVEVLGKDVSNALLGLHPFTGCDSLSALAGQGKIKPFKLMVGHTRFRKAFESLGVDWVLPQNVFDVIQDFTCQLYCRNAKSIHVNELRFNMFCTKGGDVESGQLPPCEDTLLQHSLRANYQAAIWRRSLENSPAIPDPVSGHGWERNDAGELSIKWMNGLPAPDTVLSLMSCRCVRVCRSDCTCILNGLKCTLACRLTTCTNMEDDEQEIQQDVNDSSDED